MSSAVLAATLVAAYRHRIRAPGNNEPSPPSRGAFDDGRTRALHETLPTTPLDDEYLGPIEAPVASTAYAHNFTSMDMVSVAS